jgi:hypothetical protein
MQNFDHHIGFWENQFFCWKLAKIAENCDHNIDPSLVFFIIFLVTLSGRPIRKYFSAANLIWLKYFAFLFVSRPPPFSSPSSKDNVIINLEKSFCVKGQEQMCVRKREWVREREKERMSERERERERERESGSWSILTNLHSLGCACGP